MMNTEQKFHPFDLVYRFENVLKPIQKEMDDYFRWYAKYQVDRIFADTGKLEYPSIDREAEISRKFAELLGLMSHFGLDNYKDHIKFYDADHGGDIDIEQLEAITVPYKDETLNLAAGGEEDGSPPKH